MRRKVAWLAMGVALTLPTPGLARRKKEAKKETNNIKDAIHHYEQGYRLFTLGKLVEAIEEYHAALKLDPGVVRVHVDLRNTTWQACIHPMTTASAQDTRSSQDPNPTQN